MKGGRRRILSTFYISKFGPGSSWPSPEVVLPPLGSAQAPQVSSAVRKRRVLDIGLSPRLTRQASDLKLRQNEAASSFPLPVDTKGRQPLPPLNSQDIRSVQNRGFPKQHSHGDVDNNQVLKQTCLVSAEERHSRNPYKLRRPTPFPVTPVVQNGALFHMLVKGKELKPVGIANDEETCASFYATHFPLLLRKLSETSEAVPAKRVMTEIEAEEQIKLSERRCRAREIRDRLEKAEDMLRQFETDPEDSGPIETELRSDLFNPATWPWNLERYSLDL
ncbi:hypothetical protein EGW08_018628 [Elysia chlorotica]|uniref:Uncharacterized protein n=1 Tax=Elysia chlorotica TaxID=188477 RepID=A0A433SWD9_ELYCH|nr:hypothetical protein EGW08_018628 [Elysia chlorotica]